jgi:hypothetical protein
MRALAVLLLAGCAYQAGSFDSSLQRFKGQQATVDCLDVSIERRHDLADGTAVVGYAFGNRCDHPTVVDLAAVAVVGRTADGHQVELSAYDPRHEIATLRLDGRAVGREALAYPSDAPLAEVCIDAGTIAHGATAHWMCLSSQEGQ